MNRESCLQLNNTTADSSPSDEPQLSGPASWLAVRVVAVLPAERGLGCPVCAGIDLSGFRPQIWRTKAPTHTRG